MAVKPVTCKRCGASDLKWAQSKAGKWYLTPIEGMKIRGETGRIIKTIAVGHRCEEHILRQEQEARDEALYMERLRERGLIG